MTRTRPTAGGGVVRGASWIAISLIVARGIAFVTSVVAARALSIGELAAYLVAVSVASILIPTLDLGLWQIVTRTAAKTQEAPLFGLTIRANIVRAPVWALAFLITAIVAVFYDGAPAVVTAAVLFAALGQSNLDAMCGELFARGAYGAGAAFRVLPPVIALVGTVIMAVTGPSLEWATVIFAGSRVLPPLFTLLPRALRPLRDPRITLRAGVPFAISTVVITAYTRSDLIVLQANGVNAAEVAHYGIAYSVLVAMQTLPTAIGTPLFPSVAAAPDSDRERQRRLTLSVGLATSLLAALVALAALAAARPILSIFGPSFSQDVSLVIPLFTAIIPITLSQVGVSGLQGLGAERPVLRVLLVVAALNIVGNLALVPILGVRGALIATITAETVMSIGVLVLCGGRAFPATWLLALALLFSGPLVAAAGGALWIYAALLAAGVVAVLAADVAGVREMSADAVRQVLRRAGVGGRQSA